MNAQIKEKVLFIRLIVITIIKIIFLVKHDLIIEFDYAVLNDFKYNVLISTKYVSWMNWIYFLPKVTLIRKNISLVYIFC